MDGDASVPIYVDSDNALGSAGGDVDDGFAIAALLASGVPIAGLGSVFGNTTEPLAHANHKALASLCGYKGPILRGANAKCSTGSQTTRQKASPGTGTGTGVADVTERMHRETEASRFLVNAREPIRILALGPLTNLAAALDGGVDARSRWTEVIVVGGNISSAGRWPPLWPFEFNLTKDRRAAGRVLTSDVRLTLVPLDVARALRVTAADLAALPGALGAHLRSGAARWLRRAARRKLSRSFPVWDLVAALYALDAHLFESGSTTARFHSNGWLELGAGGVEIQCVRRFDRDELWRRFVQLISGA